MSEIEQRLVIECTVDDLKTEGFVLRRDMDRGERFARAARSFGIVFMIACFTIFIPVLHFILPPLLLIVAGVFATTTWMETGQITGGSFTCPNCKKVMELRREAEDWPKKVRCEGCSYTLSLTPVR